MTLKYFTLFIFIFLISGAFAATLTMGPQQLDFTNENNCQTAVLKTNGVGTATGKVLFSEPGYNERKLSQHKLTPNERGIEITFPKEVVINNLKEIEVCVKSGVGNYHGIILYKIKGKPIQVGIWINATIGGIETISINEQTERKLEKVDASNLLVIMPVFWIMVLGMLVIIWKWKKRENYLNLNKRYI